MATNVATVTAVLDANVSRFTAGMTQAGGSLKAFSGATSTADQGMKKLRTGLQLGVAAMTAIGGAAVAMAAKFDDEFTKIGALVLGTTEGIAEMKQGVLDLAGETARAPQELAEAMFFIQSAGQRAEEAMATLELSAKAASAGLGETKDIALTVVGAMQAYANEGVNAAEVTDALTATVRAGNLEADQLASALPRIFSVAAQAGVSLQELGGATALISRTGLESSEIITGLRAAILSLNAPARIAITRLNEADLSMELMRETLAEDGLIAALKLVEEAADGDTSVFRQMLGSVEALNVANILLSASNEDIADTFGAVEDSAGVTQEAFDIAADSAGFKMRQAMVDLKVAMIELGDTFLPVAATAVSAIGSMASGFANLDASIRTPIVTFGAFATALGGVVLAAGSVLRAFAAIKAAAPAVAAAISGSLGPIAAVAGAVAIGITAWQLFRDSQSEAEQVADDLTESLKDQATAIENTTAATLEAAEAEIAAAFADHADVLADVTDALDGGKTGWELMREAMLDTSGETTRAVRQMLVDIGAVATETLGSANVSQAELDRITQNWIELGGTTDDVLNRLGGDLSIAALDYAVLRGEGLDVVDMLDTQADALRITTGNLQDLRVSGLAPTTEETAGLVQQSRDLADEAQNLTDGLDRELDVIDGVADALGRAGDATSRLRDEFDLLFGGAINLEQANIDVRSAMDDFRTALTETDEETGGLTHTNDEMVEGFLAALDSLESLREGTAGVTGDVEGANAAFAAYAAQFPQLARDLGAPQEVIDRIVGVLGTVDEGAVAEIDAENQAETIMDGIIEQLEVMDGQHRILIDADTGEALRELSVLEAEMVRLGIPLPNGTITVPTRHDSPNPGVPVTVPGPIAAPEPLPPGGARGPAAFGLASGGIVRRPQMALIGERGAEAVVPLGLGSQATADRERVLKEAGLSPGPGMPQFQQNLTLNVTDVPSEEALEIANRSMGLAIALGGRRV